MINKSIKIVVLTLIICVFALGLVVLAGQKTETVTASTPLPQPRVVEKPNIVFLCESMSDEAAQRNWQQAQIEVEHRGWEMKGLLDLKSIPEQRDAFQNVLNQNIDAIIITYLTMEPLKDLILEAREKGIGVYCLDTEIREGVIISITQPNGVAGAKMTYYGIDRTRGKGKVLILSTPDHICRQRAYVARGLLENDWPALVVVGYEDMSLTGWEKVAFDITQNYLTLYGKDLTWIFASWDSQGLFAASAVEGAGFTRDDIFVTGIDGGSQVYAEIRKGSSFVATISQPFEQYTHLIFESINQIQVEGIGIGEPGSMVPPSTVLYLESVLTTPENVPPVGAVIHEVFADTYYDPSDKDAWYTWGKPYIIQ
jgi:ABC-type sugar transport system substrate-binding protein